MRKIFFISLATFVAFVLACTVNLYAAKCQYVDKDEEKIDKQGYIMSWLFLDPYIPTGVGSTVAVKEDYLKAAGGEAGIHKDPPNEGDKIKIDGKEYVWTRVNFADLKAMGQIPAAVGGNELDIVCWGGQGVNNAGEYLISYLTYKKAVDVDFGLGSDDASELYFNGEKIHDCPVDQNWGAENCGIKPGKAKAGVNVLLVGVYESGGEWGISVKVKPEPDEISNEIKKAIDPKDKLATSWGAIKRITINPNF